MRCFWFSQNDKRAPSTRYRGLFLLEELRRKRGVSAFFAFPSYKPWNIARFVIVYLLAYLTACERDVVVIQKVMSNRIYARLLLLLVRTTRARTIYDLDDAEYLRYSDRFINRFVTLCDTVVVGSEDLGRYVAPRNPNWRHITSGIIAHGVLKTEKEKIFTIGWIGFYDDHQNNLETLVFPALKSLDLPFRLVVLGVRRDQDEVNLRNQFDHSPQVQLEIPRDLDWLSEKSIYQRVRRFDVGLAPLVDGEHTRSKSAFKAKQYLSCGVPVLASSVGENPKFVRDGVNGFLCDHPEVYRKRLIEMIQMPHELYQAMSDAALASFGEFSLASVAAKFYSVATEPVRQNLSVSCETAEHGSFHLNVSSKLRFEDPDLRAPLSEH